MTLTENRIITFTTERKHADLDSVKEKITTFLTKNNVHSDLVSTVELSLYEAIINIIDHEPKKYILKPINTTCMINNGCITIELVYEGNKFDMTKVKLPDIVAHFKKGKKRGLGIYFIRTLMDKVEYSYSDGMNKLTLIKKT
ncbi:MAG TPA: ATP-binding protein [Spirochaetota bacterium]|nr:ATP-binding protein [Spirochaetota bacterium]HPI89791.1 ATP-binding protein [Spirochaetota bacterium]HPR47568.1 ATP-binding protein [Spirochaetota bacterium]